MNDPLRTFRISALRDLQMQIFGIQRTVFDQFCKNNRQICLIDIGSRDIDGVRNEGQTLVAPFAQLITYTFPYLLIQLIDKSVFLKEWNEFVRRQESKIRMCPAHECLSADHAVVLQTIFRLEINGKFTGL